MLYLYSIFFFVFRITSPEREAPNDDDDKPGNDEKENDNDGGNYSDDSEWSCQSTGQIYLNEVMKQS